MKNVRIYGESPYRVAVVHGGPGIAGAVAPVADELSRTIGVLEPLQTIDSLEGQVIEWQDVLKEHGSIPVILIGHSWGAFLSLIVASRFPLLVKKLVLVSGGPFEENYADIINTERLNRLTEAERIEVFDLMEIIDGSAAGDKDNAMSRLNGLFARADTYSLLPQPENDILVFSEEINRRVWAEAKPLVTGGEILRMAEKIKCPVVAIHGDYDTHLPEGVKEPLSRVLKDFKFILLEKCGHEPWLETFARDKFYKILKNELEY